MPYTDAASVVRLSGRWTLAPAGPPAITVVIPTRNEAGNVEILLRGLELSLVGLQAEVLFVDDSDDDTPAVVLRSALTSPLRVRLLHRAPGQRQGGLAGAVVAGLGVARAPWAVVMDGDLQHPPALVPQLVSSGVVNDADVVVASRYCAGGDRAGLAGALRCVVSRSATTVTRALFPHRLHRVTDPLTGFFAVRLDSVDLSTFRPVGFKILLELLVRTGGAHVVEVPFVFGTRATGRSKASVREGLRFVTLLGRLRLASAAGRAALESPLLQSVRRGPSGTRGCADPWAS